MITSHEISATTGYALDNAWHAEREGLDRARSRSSSLRWWHPAAM
jgi:hypothetical protein